MINVTSKSGNDDGQRMFVVHIANQKRLSSEEKTIQTLFVNEMSALVAAHGEGKRGTLTV